MAWAKNGTPDTLTGVSDTMTISNLTSKKFNQILTHAINSGTIETAVRLGKTTIDTGTNYAKRQSLNGLGDTTAVNQTGVFPDGLSSDIFQVSHIVNIGTEEKLMIINTVKRNSTGAGAAPARGETVGKWVNTNQFDNVQSFNSVAGDYATDSNLSALGTD